MIQLLFSRLRLWKKMAVLLALFAVPIAITSTLLHSSLMKNIRASELELYGSEYLKHIAELEIGLHEIEYAGYYASSRTDGIAERVARGIQLSDAALSELIKAHSKFSMPLEQAGLAGVMHSSFPVTPVEIKAKWESIRSVLNTSNIEEAFKDIELLDEKALLLRTYVANASGLVLDPEHTTYYLMNIIVFLSPELLDQLKAFVEYSQDLSSSSDDKSSTAFKEFLKSDGIVFGSIIPRIKNTLGLVLASRQSLTKSDQEIIDSLRTISNDLEKSLLDLENRINEAAVNKDKSSSVVLEKIIDQCVSSLSALVRESQDLMVNLLKSRIDQYLSTQLVAFAITAGMFLVLSVFSWIIVRSITTPISHLVTAARKAAKEGDLTQKVEAIGGGEIGELSSSFNSMIENLHRMVLQVQSSGQLVSSSAMEIAAVSKQQQATSSEIAATTIQIEATSKEISSTSKQLASTMREVSAVAEQTTTLANGGQEGIQKMEQTMNSIMEASASISAKLAVLNDKANKINTVVTTISKVADQTNLLSLNAAIEAEKAGEFGQGFSVVAREIRRLADQTAIATLDIEKMVEEMQSAVSAGVMGMERFSDEVRRGAEDIDSISGQLEEIITQVQTLTPRFESVNDGMEAQSSGAQQISDGLSQLSEAAQQTAASIKQSSQSIEHLQDASEKLSESVTGFKLGDVHADA